MSIDNILSVLDSFEQRILDAYRKINDPEQLTLYYLDDLLAHQEIFIKFKSDMYHTDSKLDKCFDFIQDHFSTIVPDIKKRLRDKRIKRFLSDKV